MKAVLVPLDGSPWFKSRGRTNNRNSTSGHSRVETIRSA
jgi:hypothetical protein